MKKEFTLKKYDNLDEIILASWKLEDESITLEDLKDSKVTGLDISENEHSFSYDDQKRGIEEQGLWGWVDLGKTIHYWLGKEVPIEEIIHFLAHEIGHRTGVGFEDGFQEEMRAEGFGNVATLAYQFAKQITG